MNDPEYFRIGLKETDGQLEIRLKINEKTGITTVEEYYRDHRHHRDGAPAYVVRDAVTGIVTREYWCRDGRQHREDGPAVIARDAQRGTVIEEHWYIDGQKTAPRAVGRPTDVRCAIQIPGDVAAYDVTSCTGLQRTAFGGRSLGVEPM